MAFAPPRFSKRAKLLVAPSPRKGTRKVRKGRRHGDGTGDGVSDGAVGRKMVGSYLAPLDATVPAELDMMWELAEELHVGMRVQVNHVNRYLGVVAYIGACHLGPGAWVGVYMDDRVGLYDGCIDGIKYFECEDGYGVLVPPDGVIPIPVSHPGMRTLEGHAPEERYYLKRKKKREDMRRQHSRRSHTRTPRSGRKRKAKAAVTPLRALINARPDPFDFAPPSSNSFLPPEPNFMNTPPPQKVNPSALAYRLEPTFQQHVEESAIGDVEELDAGDDFRHLVRPYFEQFSPSTLRKENPEIYDRVIVGGRLGVILFYAETLFAFGKWVGIELDAPLAPGSEIFAGRDFRQLDEDGEVEGVFYFRSRKRSGVMARPDAVAWVPPEAYELPPKEALISTLGRENADAMGFRGKRTDPILMLEDFKKDVERKSLRRAVNAAPDPEAAEELVLRSTQKIQTERSRRKKRRHKDKARQRRYRESHGLEDGGAAATAEADANGTNLAGAAATTTTQTALNVPSLLVTPGTPMRASRRGGLAGDGGGAANKSAAKVAPSTGWGASPQLAQLASSRTPQMATAPIAPATPGAGASMGVAGVLSMGDLDGVVHDMSAFAAEAGPTAGYANAAALGISPAVGASTLKFHALDNKLQGVLVGHLVGGAVGRLVMGASPREIQDRFPDGIFLSKSDGPLDASTSADALVVLDALDMRSAASFAALEAQYAERLKMAVDSERVHAGTLVAAAVDQAQFIRAPTAAAKRAMRTIGDGSSDHNVAVLRAPLIGFLFWDVHAVALGARRVCAVTHADPRCAASCVAVAVAVAMMLRDRRFAETADGMVEMIETATTLALAEEDVPDVEAFVAAIQTATPDDIRASSRRRRNDTYKALALAFYALRTGTDYATAVSDVVAEGGNTAVNGALAGALLGCKLGRWELPRTWDVSQAWPPSRIPEHMPEDWMAAMASYDVSAAVEALDVFRGEFGLSANSYATQVEF